MSGRVVAVCMSSRTGQPKRRVPRATLREQHGLVGDAHAGAWHRQVSLLDEESVRSMEAKGLRLAPGAFGENIVVAGLELGELGIGSRLRVGAGELEITQIGKVCHSRCAIFYRTGDCIMPRLGLFAVVTRGGPVETGSSVEVVQTVPRRLRQLGLVAMPSSEESARHLAAGLAAVGGVHVAALRMATPAEAAGAVEDLGGRGLAAVVLLTHELAPEAARRGARGTPVIVVDPAVATAHEVLERSSGAAPHAAAEPMKLQEEKR